MDIISRVSKGLADQLLAAAVAAMLVVRAFRLHAAESRVAEVASPR